MRDELLEILVDPISRGPLRLTTARRDPGGVIVDGRLSGSDGAVYNIIDYVPRLVAGSDPAQRQTALSFAFKWNQKHTYTEGMLDQTRRWLTSRYGFASAEEMLGYMADRGRVFDAGCGSGFSTSLWLTPQWNGMWVGAEISEAIDIARRPP